MFLIQNPNVGGLTNMVGRWKDALEKNNYDVDLKTIEKDDYNLDDYELIHLFFSPFYSKKLFFRLMTKKIFSKKRNVILTYYNIKRESKLKLYFKKILIGLTIDKLALPSYRMVSYYKKLGIKNSFIISPIVPEGYSKYQKKRKKYISYFGALREDKGIDNLIRVSKIISEKIYFAGFKVGNKKSEDYFYEIMKSNKFVGFKGNHIELVASSKVVLFPYVDLSSTIDMPLALLESMKMGSVVLASNIAPLSYFLPKECLVDNWNNKKEVLSKIEYLEKNNMRMSKYMVKIVSNLGVDEKSFLKNYKMIIN